MGWKWLGWCDGEIEPYISSSKRVYCYNSARNTSAARKRAPRAMKSIVNFPPCGFLGCCSRPFHCSALISSCRRPTSDLSFVLDYKKSLRRRWNFFAWCVTIFCSAQPCSFILRSGSSNLSVVLDKSRRRSSLTLTWYVIIFCSALFFYSSFSKQACRKNSNQDWNTDEFLYIVCPDSLLRPSKHVFPAAFLPPSPV